MSTEQERSEVMTEEAFYAAMKELLAQGLKTGRLRLDDLNTLLENVTLTQEEQEKIHDSIRQMGIDLITEQTEAAQEDATARKMLMEIVREILARDELTAREADIIRIRFGLMDGQPHTLEEAAQAFGVTRERIRMVENKTIRRYWGHLRRKKQIRDFYQ